MTLRELVIKEYQSHVRNHPQIPHELKIALRSNERVPAFLDNLVIEMKTVEALKGMTNNKMREVVRSMTDTFVTLVMKKAEQDSWSSAKKAAEKQNEYKQKIIEAAADKINSETENGNNVIDLGEETISVLKENNTQISEIIK